MPNKPGTLLVELGPEDKEYQAVDEEVIAYYLVFNFFSAVIFGINANNLYFP